MEDNWELIDVKWAEDIQNNLGAYLDGLMENLDDADTVSGLSFCGCDTCYLREVLCYVTPRIIQAYVDGKVKLTD